jgi:hypothetical protein
MTAPYLKGLIYQHGDADEGVLNLEATNIKALAETVMDVCLKNDVGYWTQCKPGELGIHQKNRHGGGADAVDMASNVKGLVTLGFSNKESHLNAGGELGPKGSDARKEAVDFNKQISESEYFPPFVEDRNKVLCCSGTHTGIGVKAVDSEVLAVRSEGVSELLNDEGHWSKSKIIEKCPTMKVPLEQGIWYFVVRFELEELVLLRH